MSDVVIREFAGSKGRYILVSLDAEEHDVHAGNPKRRMGSAAGRYAKARGFVLAMSCRASRVGDADWYYDSDRESAVWQARYNLVTEHLPLGEMLRVMRENGMQANSG